MNNIFIFLIILVIFSLAAGIWKIYRSSKKQEGSWGVNINPLSNWHSQGVLKNVSCPVCGKELDAFRKPENIREVLWGGWTCTKCGASIDKWGKERK